MPAKLPIRDVQIKRFFTNELLVDLQKRYLKVNLILKKPLISPVIVLTGEINAFQDKVI